MLECKRKIYFYNSALSINKEIWSILDQQIDETDLNNYKTNCF